MLEQFASAFVNKPLFIGLAPITVTEVKLGEYSKSPVSQNEEARIDVGYVLKNELGEEKTSGYFSFYISSDIFTSEKTGKTQYLTSNAQFIWALNAEEAKKGLVGQYGENATVLVAPSARVYPAYKKLEPFIAFLCATIGINPRKGTEIDFVQLLRLDALFTDKDAVSAKLAELSEDLTTQKRDKVKVLFLVDEQGRNRIDTKNPESFMFPNSTNTARLVRAIKQKAQTSYPYISGTYSLNFQEYDASKQAEYANELAKMFNEGSNESWEL